MPLGSNSYLNLLAEEREKHQKQQLVDKKGAEQRLGWGTRVRKAETV